MIEVKEITFPAFTGEEKRRLYVYLPAGYEYETDRLYPVLYMFDGHNVFFDSDATYGRSWRLGEYLDMMEVPLIVAALECHHGENLERLYEYSPYDFEQKGFGRIKGFGRETMEFFVRQLKPEMDRKYRTLKDRRHTFIGGSSMGGLMAVYAVLEYNEYFSKAAALSPAVFMCYDNIKELVNRFHSWEDTAIYMDVGTREAGRQMIKRFGSFAQTLAAKGIAVTARIVPEGTHSEASWSRQLPFAIETLMYDSDETLM